MQKKSVFYFTILGLLSIPFTSDAGIRVGNSSRSNAQGYQQVNAMRSQSAEQNNSAAIAVSPSSVAPANRFMQAGTPNTPTNNSSDDTGAITQANQERQAYCSTIYPNGEFTWGRPNIGKNAGGEETCVAVIEMRAANAAPDGKDLTFARAYLAAGDVVKCNISDFPESSYLPVPNDFYVPADNEPTIDDVKAQMNKEQKQNAGLKIAATALITGLAGNFMAESEPGSDSMLGFGKKKIFATLEGAAGGAALGAASAFSGKVGGDMIMSAGMNMMAGGIIGNMGATSGEDLLFRECKKPGETENSGWCLMGYVEQTGDEITDGIYVNTTKYTDTQYCSTENDRTTKEDSNKKAKCEYTQITGVSLSGYPTSDDDVKTSTDKAIRNSIKSMDDNVLKYAQNDEYSKVAEANKGFCISNEGTMIEANNAGSLNPCRDEKRYVKIDKAKKVTKTIPAAIYFDEKPHGKQTRNWASLKSNIGTAYIYGRAAGDKLIAINLGNTFKPNEDGGIGINKESSVINEFRPISVAAEDASLIDMNSRARAKATGIGAGMGGAMGAFSAYQGAQSEIEERWLSEVRNYKDSLSKFYCMTGSRFLSRYNDYVSIPAVKTDDEQQQ